MEAYQTRVIEERYALGRKIIKLTTWLYGNLEEIESDERALEQQQLCLMMEYSNVLAERIAMFTKSNQRPSAKCQVPNTKTYLWQNHPVQ